MKKLYGPVILLFSILVSAFSFCANGQSRFTFTENGQGIELFEEGRPVFFYQREPKSIDGRYICNNYIHPLFSIDGDTLTDEFPEDHPYHRGIYWAWHQIYIDSKSVSDGWVMENISEKVIDIHSNIQNNLARLDLDVEWKSSIYQSGKPFILENTTVWVHPLKGGIRLIDFEITLKALVPEISIGGSDDEKGYGGFCIRMKLPPDLIFTSTNGPVIPRTLQMKAGSWMDFSGSFGKDEKKNGLTILCHSCIPKIPVNWILRKETAMQNIVFPGRQRVDLPMDKPIILRYRVIVHNGTAGDVDIASFQAEYIKYSYPNSGPQIK